MASKKKYMTAKIEEELAAKKAKELEEAQYLAYQNYLAAKLTAKNNLREEFKAKELDDKLLFLYDKYIEMEEKKEEELQIIRDNFEEKLREIRDDLDKKENKDYDNYSM